MKIVEVKKLEDGVNGITTEGKIIKILKKPSENEHGWSQFVKIKDDTDDMASWINIETAEDAYKIGQYISIKGKVSRYTKGNKPQMSFHGNVIDEVAKDEDVSQEQPIQKTTKPVEKTQEEPEKDMEEVWEAKDLRGVKMGITRHATDLIVAGVIKLKERFNYMKEELDFFYKPNVKVEIVKPPIIIVEEAKEEFGGTQTEESKDPEKEEKIAKAKELVENLHLAEPVNDTMATVKQKKQIFGYIDKEGKKVGGIVDSQYMKDEEKLGIGKWQDLTKKRAILMWETWYGKEGEMGERDKRELAAKDKKESPFITERQPLEKRDKNDDASLAKDELIEKINKMRKTYGLMDEEKFMVEFGCNAKFKLWTEKELNKLKEKLEMYKPDWVTEK